VSEWASHAVEGGVVIRHPDPGHAASTVTLWSDLELDDTTFAAVPEGWELTLSDLPVDRLEYLVAVDGDMRLDATQPLRVDGAFGEHSWLPLAGYSEPSWLGWPRIEGESDDARLEDTPVGAIDLTVWAPAGSLVDEPLPLLLSHDGPEMAAYGGLLDYVASGIEAGILPRMRVALLHPGARNERYAANPAYTKALTEDVIPHLLAVCPTEHPPVIMGQSLGALAALHAAWTAPTAFGGLCLQSGSFFTPDLDPQESGFEWWTEITSFVRTVFDAQSARPDAPRMALVCGSAEENYANNRLMAAHLSLTGVHLTWGEVRDGHTWTCWRDTLHPHLTDLLTAVWSTGH
jgi:enterochelin esterase-like enzyme